MYFQKESKISLKTGKTWGELTPEEKREERFQRWLSLPIKFDNKAAEKAYKERVTRFIKAIKLEKPDRVPVILPAGFFAAYYNGGNLKKVMYDYDELKRAWLKFMQDFEMDTFAGPGLVLPGKVLDIIDYRIEKWPGHGLADDVSSYQYIEGEYMPPEEYDVLIRDPADYLWRYFLSRACGSLKAFRKLGPVTPFIGIPVFHIAQYADPEIRQATLIMLEAAQETARWQEAVGEVSMKALTSGLPFLSGGMSGAPFDMIGDMLRGTVGIMKDIYRRPEKLQEAMERMVPTVVEEAVNQANASGCPVVMMPLHKGMDTFMSGKQFETFYWPTFRKVMMGLINEGCIPMPFAEGQYNNRLEIIKDLPRGSVIWYFEATDMAKAKKLLGNQACIAGNIPVSLLCTGTPQQIKEHCKRLIEICGPGGGYILTGGAQIDKGDPANLRAIMEAAKEFGVYKK
jgi:uroporphyrinogen-III decarboxylase